MAILKRFIPNFLKKKIKDEINKNYLFSGWNMQTNTCPPWKYINKNEINNSQIPYFTDIQKEFENLIISKKFISNQYEVNMLEKSRELMWRHYNLALSLKYVLKKIKKNISLCEAGVADGITAWFALRILLEEKIENHTFWMYDSWEEMRKEFLNEDEYRKIGKFDKNNLLVTKKNLDLFKNTKFIKGFIPEIFEENKNFPETCDWLHIDLNSSNATMDTLNFFEPKLSEKSLILFDDFGWPSYESTRISIEKWCSARQGILWPLPTGQALYFVDKD